MNNSSKGKLGELFVEKYLQDQKFNVRKKVKGETGFDLVATKKNISFTIEVKTSENLKGGIPDMHDTEFYKVADEWKFKADYLYVVRLKNGLPFQLDILTKNEIDLYSSSHKTVTRIRTMKLDKDLHSKKLGVSIDI
jgi:Holliday junction resolvase-like predicted endonuclease